MDTISNKIKRLYSATSAIKDAILSKGGTVLTSDGLEAFPQAISTIPVGGSGIEVADEDVEMLRSMVDGNYQESVVSFDVWRLRNSAFVSNSKIVEANFPYCFEIESYAFSGCSSLQQVSFPNCNTIGRGAFNGCSSLQQVSFPNCSTIGQVAFNMCTSLQSVNFPNCNIIEQGAFSLCSSLQQVNFPNCSTIGELAFQHCYSLQSVYLLSTSVCTLFNSEVFNHTPLSQSSYLGHYGSIYVPSSLLTAYKTATNWVRYSSRFVGV